MAHAVWPQQAKISVISDEKERFNAVTCNHDCSVAYAVAALGKNLLKSVDRGRSWQASGLDQAGLVDYVDVATDYDGKDIALACDKDGAFSSGILLYIPKHVVWQRLGDKSRSWSAVSMDSSGRYISAAASGETIVSFNNTVPMGSMVGPAQCCYFIAVNWDTGKYQVAIGNMGIYTSFDYGRHFNLTHPSVAQFCEAASDGPGKHWVAVALNGGILHSHDYGQSWNQSICLDDNSNEFLCSNQRFGSVSVSADGATALAAVGQKYSTNSVFVGSVFLSTDFGATFWSIPGTPRDRQWSSVVLSKDGSYMMTAVSGDNLGYIGAKPVLIFYGTVPSQSTHFPTEMPTHLPPSAPSLNQWIFIVSIVAVLLVLFPVTLRAARPPPSYLDRIMAVLNEDDVCVGMEQEFGTILVNCFSKLLPRIDLAFLANESIRLYRERPQDLIENEADRSIDDYRERPQDLVENEGAAIVAMTLDVVDASNQRFYYEVNRLLRQRENDENPAVIRTMGSFLKCLIQGVRKMPQFRDKFFRGIPFAVREENTYHPRKKGEAMRFALQNNNNNNSNNIDISGETTQLVPEIRDPIGIIFEIRSSVGYDISSCSATKIEAEILLLPDSTFIVMESFRENNILVIVLRGANPHIY